ncbi:hypothetical protein ACQ86N_18645 [Puia sp. P3]|uniref:hypothetical protein n=1 Tax=Puia sp. P3 TaxID=3423952 RepID=UPI003D677419
MVTTSAILVPSYSRTRAFSASAAPFVTRPLSAAAYWSRVGRMPAAASSSVLIKFSTSALGVRALGLCLVGGDVFG